MVEAAAISVTVARVNKTRLSAATSSFDMYMYRPSTFDSRNAIRNSVKLKNIVIVDVAIITRTKYVVQSMLVARSGCSRLTFRFGRTHHLPSHIP